MNTATWYSQPFRADGGITADGLLGQLGRPQLSRLTILVREAAQNSWDARCSDQPVVRFRLDLSAVGAAHMGEWRRLFSNALPQSGDTDNAFRKLSQAPSIRYLAVSDRGTKGLGGPTRSDAGHSSRREWLRFVLNSGDREDGQQPTKSGGTFGYGKGAFFLTSKVGCVFVYTRFRDEDDTLHSRFIGAAIRKAFWHNEAQYTGRHWWGSPDASHCEPLHDAAADDTARRLGLPEFSGQDTGTTLIIVDPDLTDPTLPDSEVAQEMDIQDTGTYLAEAAAWNLWPIMLVERETRMEIAVTAHGIDIPVPSPLNDAALAFFADSYRRTVEGRGEILSCLRPKKELGDFAYEYTYGATVTSPAARDLGIEGAPHHICLIRGPELVTRYFPGPERPNPHVGYAGTFKVSDELDPIFARSEPPTHDAWAYQQLKGHESTFVRTLARRLRERCEAISGATNKKAFKIGEYAVGSVAQRLGHLLAGPGGTGAAIVEVSPRPGQTYTPAHSPEAADSNEGDQHSFASGTAWDESRTTGSGIQTGDMAAPASPGARTTAPRRPTLVSTPRYEVVAGHPVVVQPVRLHGSGRNEGHVKVVTGEGGTENTSPIGATEPEILGWRTADGQIVPGGILYNSEGVTEVELLVIAVPDAVLDINVTGQHR
ncbi:hypothetical protein ACFYXH_27520 [Streptomyces sp. NPDC002730]|uniref:hypothetical protein n=1 Tax=Streptomyces sp. NPDC002730 TaxID=3364662 RepID=UPI003687616B